MSIYVFLNWLMCVLTSILLVVVIVRYRYLFLKPSMVVIALYHIQVQWAATVDAGMIEQFLPRPYPFLLLAQAFPLFGIMVSFFILHRRTFKVFTKISHGDIRDAEVKPRTLAALFSAICVILLAYLAIVPLSRTGIYAILWDPLSATMARESSLKLLESEFLKYGYSVLKAAIAPLLCVLSALYLLRSLRDKKLTRGALAIYLILFTLAVVSLPGARMPAAMLILTILLALYIAYNMPMSPSYLLLSFLLTFSLPVMFTIFREGQAIDFSIFFDYMKGGVFRRVFYIPMETGLWHMHHAQTSGFVGVAGIPKLAKFLAVEPINLSNLIYMKYSIYNFSSGLCNTSYVFAYYACFGTISLVFSLFGLWLLDLAVVLLDKLRSRAILLATAASLVTSSFWFVSTTYTTVFVSNGFGFILLFAFLLDKFSLFHIVSPGKRNSLQS